MVDVNPEENIINITVSQAKSNTLVDATNNMAKYYEEQAKAHEQGAELQQNNARIWAEGTDEEVETLGGIHSAKVWAGTFVQEQADWLQTDDTQKDYIKNKPALATVALSGDYNDLSDTPDIPAKVSDLENDSNFQTDSDVETTLADYVPTSRTINGQPLTNDITLNVSEYTKFAINKGNPDLFLQNASGIVYKKRNITETGSLTWNNALATGFSASNYLNLPSGYSFNTANTWELFLGKVNCTNVSGVNTIFGTSYIHYGYHPLAITLSNGKLNAYGYRNWVNNFLFSFSGTTTLQNNTDYYIKLEFTSSAYNLYLSTNNDNWNLEGSVSTSNKVTIDNTFNLWSLGILTSNSALAYPFAGTIDLSQCYLKMDNQLVWQGVIDGTSLDYDYTESTVTQLMFDVDNTNPLTYTNIMGETHTVTTLSPIDVSGENDGTYKVVLSNTNNQPYLFGGTVYNQEIEPLPDFQTKFTNYNFYVENNYMKFADGGILAFPDGLNADGSKKFLYKTVSALSFTITTWSSGNVMPCVQDNNGVFVFYTYYDSQWYNQTTQPTVGGIWYNPETNIIKDSPDGITWTTQNVSLPIGRAVCTSGTGFTSLVETYQTPQVLWINPQEPYSAKQYDGSNWQEFNDVLLLDSSVAVTSGVISNLVQPRYNSNHIEPKFQNNPQIIETYNNGSSWYRIYSDGWCEQGGTATGVNSSSGLSINLLKEYKDNLYNVLTTVGQLISAGASSRAAQVLTKTTTYFNVMTQWSDSGGYGYGAYPFDWKTCGYIK